MHNSYIDIHINTKLFGLPACSAVQIANNNINRSIGVYLHYLNENKVHRVESEAYLVSCALLIQHIFSTHPHTHTHTMYVCVFVLYVFVHL